MRASVMRAWLRRERAAECPEARAGERTSLNPQWAQERMIFADDPYWWWWIVEAAARREVRADLRCALAAGRIAYDEAVPSWGGFGGLEERREVDLGDRFEADVVRVLGEELRASEDVRGELWSALADLTWVHATDRDHASYSMRAAGDLVAAVSGVGNYMTYYCAGPIAIVSPRIADALGSAGWVPDWFWYDEREEDRRWE